MNVKIELSKIQCTRTTRELGKDEIYFAILVVAGKMENGEFVKSDQNALTGKVSEVKTKVQKGMAWRPELNDIIIDLGDAEAFSVVLALYERDNAKLYEELQKGVEKSLELDSFDWNATTDEAKAEIIMDINDNNKTDFKDLKSAVKKLPNLTVVAISGFLLGLAMKLFKHFRQDDLLGVNVESFHPQNENFGFPQTYQFNKFRGRYEVVMQASELKEEPPQVS